MDDSLLCPTATTLHLLTLPGEIRTLIYHQVFEQATITVTNKSGKNPYVWLSSAFALSFLATCRVFYREAGPILRSNIGLVLRDNARPHQLKCPVHSSYAAKIRRITVQSSKRYSLLPNEAPDFSCFPALELLQIESSVSSYDYGFARLPKTTCDEDLMEILRKYVDCMRDKCDWVANLMNIPGGAAQRGFKMEVVVDFTESFEWFSYWMKDGLRLSWKSTFDADSLNLVERQYKEQ